MASGRTVVAPDRDTGWLRKLFESGVRGYLKAAHSDAWSVGATHLGWHASSSSTEDLALLSTMKTDVTLDHRHQSRRVIVETKFSDVFTEYKGVTRIKRDFVFQLYAYLRSQTGGDDGSWTRQRVYSSSRKSVGTLSPRWSSKDTASGSCLLISQGQRTTSELDWTRSSPDRAVMSPSCQKGGVRARKTQ